MLLEQTKRQMDKNNFRVSIIIPNYNGRELLAENLPSVVLSKKEKRNQILEIIIVDDASTDDSVELIRKFFPEIKIVRHKANRGFSASVNTGARTATGDLLVLLNSDVSPEKRFLINVISHFNDENVFGVSLHEKGYGPAKGKLEGGFIVHDPAKESSSAKETFWVNGGSGVFRRSYWMKLGGMDEKLFSPFYWEDVDLSYRAAKRGWKNLWEPNSKVVHKHESTIGKISRLKRQKIQERNQLLFTLKNLTSPTLFRRHLSGIISRIGKHPGYIIILIMALTKISIAHRLRVKEKKESKISDEAIFDKFKND